ncbi:Dihydrofolate synthase / Folylpolyglutamate synthase [Streptococcus oralis]|nr:Dihydrofolate synthase / Folylpolyglutamate synthase [Streptococcus oralis]
MNEIENNQWIAHYRTDQPHFGLERMVELLALRGNPHLKLKVIHIGGTEWQGFNHCFFEKDAGRAKPESWGVQLALSHSLYGSD